jgi:hypothetical protein
LIYQGFSSIHAPDLLRYRVYAPHGINIKDRNTTDPGREPPYIQRMMDEIQKVYGHDFFTLDYNDMDARIAATKTSKM